MPLIQRLYTTLTPLWSPFGGRWVGGTCRAGCGNRDGSGRLCPCRGGRPRGWGVWLQMHCCSYDVVLNPSSSRVWGKSTGKPDTMTKLICFWPLTYKILKAKNVNAREIKCSGVQGIWYRGIGPSSSVGTLLSSEKLCIRFFLYQMNR